MSDANRDDFGARLKRIDRTHRKVAQGYVTSVNHDGLIIAVPRRRRVRVPFGGIALIAMAVIGFKGLVHAHLGAVAYDERISSLSAGSSVEKVGAWIMQADPVTRAVSQAVSTLGR